MFSALFIVYVLSFAGTYARANEHVKRCNELLGDIINKFDGLERVFEEECPLKESYMGMKSWLGEQNLQDWWCEDVVNEISRSIPDDERNQYREGLETIDVGIAGAAELAKEAWKDLQQGLSEIDMDAIKQLIGGYTNEATNYLDANGFETCMENFEHIIENDLEGIMENVEQKAEEILKEMTGVDEIDLKFNCDELKYDIQNLIDASEETSGDAEFMEEEMRKALEAVETFAQGLSELQKIMEGISQDAFNAFVDEFAKFVTKSTALLLELIPPEN